MTVKPLELGKKVGIREIAINDSYRIIRIKCRNQVVTCCLNCFHMTRRYITSSTDQGKVFHYVNLNIFIYMFATLSVLIDQARKTTKHQQPSYEFLTLITFIATAPVPRKIKLSAQI